MDGFSILRGIQESVWEGGYLMGEVAKGFFELNEGIFLISSNFTEKQQIEEGLNREIDRIVTVSELIKAFTDLTTSEGIRASVIITSEIPVEIRKSLEDVREVLEVAKLPVFEIGVGDIVKDAYRFGNIQDFLVFARSNKRQARISEVKDKEQRDILQELQIESEVRLEKIESLEEEIDGLEKEVEKVRGQYNTLKTEVEQVYKVQRDNAIDAQRGLEEELENVGRLYDIEKEKSEQYRQEKDSALGELTELKITLVSLEKLVKEKQEEVRKLERTVESRDEEIKRHIREKDNILTSKVDAEDHVMLNEELTGARDEVQRLQGIIANMEIVNRQVKYEKELVEKENELLRDGDVDIKELGRTMRLDTYKFERVNLIYIKIFEWLPYMRLALQKFFDEVEERVEGRSHMMILRHDDGLDTEYFRGVPLWSKLKDVPATDKVFRIFPSQVMFARLEGWERTVDTLVVVDNIKNNTYYLESRAMEKYMTVVRKDTDMERYGLKGSAITIRGDSIFDVGEDSTIATAGIESNRRRLLEVKVGKWVDKVLGE